MARFRVDYKSFDMLQMKLLEDQSNNDETRMEINFSTI